MLSAVWCEPVSTPRAPSTPSRAYGQEPRVRLDRVLQRRAMDLDRVRDPGARQRPREDRRAHDQMVGERHVRARAGGDIRHGGHVVGDVAVELGVAEVLERARLDVLVAVGHVHGQQPADVGAVDGCARLAQSPDDQLAAVPVADCADPSSSSAWRS